MTRVRWVDGRGEGGRGGEGEGGRLAEVPSSRGIALAGT